MLVQQIDNPQTCLLHRTSVAQSWCNVVNPNRPNRLTQWKLFRVLTQIVAPCLLHRLLQLAASTQNFHFESSRCSNQNSKSTRYTEHSAFLISAPCWGVQLQPKPNKTLKVLWRWKKRKTFNMCGWLSLTQKSSIGSCRLHWIRSQEISFDKPIVFAPKSPDTPKGNRESFFGRKQFENTPNCLGRLSMNLIWYVHQNHFIAGVQHFSCFRPPDVQQSDPRRQRPWPRLTQVVWKGWETDPLWVCRQPVFPLCWLRNGSFLKAWVPNGAMNGSRDQAWHDAKLRKLEVWWVCCITVAGCCSCFALCGSWFFEVYLGVFQSTLRLFWSTDPKERPGTFS